MDKSRFYSFIPMVTFEVQSKDSIPTIIEKIKRHVEMDKSKQSFFRSNLKLAGAVSSTGFKLFRIDSPKGSFDIEGWFHSSGNATQIHIKIYLIELLYMCVFLGLWMSSGLLMLILLIVTEGVSYKTILVLVILFFPWLMFHAMFWSKIDETKEMITKAIKGEE
jgi:hypothetical protein